MKKSNVLIVALLFLVGVLAWTTGCKKDDVSPDFLIQIDSVVHIDTISLIDTLDVSFYGYIGNNSCYKFLRYEAIDRSNSDPLNSMKFKVWGTHEDNGNCFEEIQYLDGGSVKINGFVEGDFFLYIIQPDGTIMASSVYIDAP